ncbi:MAG TPA: hypothetical protein VK524_03825 [Polyangiaceae bacterium]|nr:hypothetical protein [Polyangiaceae bacterium]
MATQADKVNTGAMATIVAVLAISVLGIAAALTALVRYETANHGAQKGVSANMRTVRELTTKQRSQLSAEPSWADKDRQLVAVPVERAMDLVVQDLRTDANLATEGAAGDAGASSAVGAARGDAGAAAADAGPTANELGMKGFDRQHAGQPSGSGGVTPAQAVRQGGDNSKADPDTSKAPKKAPAPAPKPAPGEPQTAPGGKPAPNP